MSGPSSKSELRRFVAASPLRRGAICSFVDDFAKALPPGTKVLDVGAGAAPYRSLFSAHDYRTHDWPNSVHSGARDVVGDIQAGLDVAEASYGAVICTEVLEHVLDLRAALAEIRRLLVSGGAFGATVPFAISLHEEPWDYWRLTPYALEHLLEAAGFRDIEVAPTTGYFGTMAELLIDMGLSTRDPVRPTILQRVVGKAVKTVALIFARISPALDRLDRRKALPAGWIIRAAAD